MTSRKPLVLIDGVISQLPDTDVLLGELEYMRSADEVDFVGEDIIYKGWMETPGTLVSEAKWRIQRVEFVGPDEDVSSRWANDDDGYVHVWSDRDNPANWS